MKTPLYCLLPFFKFCPTPQPLPCRFQSPTLTAFSVVLILLLNGGPRYIWCAILLNDIKDLHIEPRYLSTRRTLMCVLLNKASSLLRSDTWCGFLLVLWFDITHRHKDTQHTQGPVDWHTHTNIYLHHLLCAHSSHLYCVEWIVNWYQKFTSKIIHL